ncbi:hypothetical protein DPMN_000896 [Dreissena polymorpha]|uniref:Uncharacterized protein n=1 Tax=Dreissena polymorpha TaxID=45954 RepID=A0A9D4MIW9_DREPO|nr:hypothetical protein DPMN_000896 [Dreissena polymorpha]
MLAGRLFHKEHPREQNDLEPKPLTFGIAKAPLLLDLVLYEWTESWGINDSYNQELNHF